MVRFFVGGHWWGLVCLLVCLGGLEILGCFWQGLGGSKSVSGAYVEQQLQSNPFQPSVVSTTKADVDSSM